MVNKVADLHCLVETERPDVIIGTESWLSPDIKDSEIFPQGYTPYRADRTTKTTRSGGVFVLVVDTLICSEQPQLRSECEITWVKLEVVGTQPLYLAAFYKPREDDQDSLDGLRSSLDGLTSKKGNIIVAMILTFLNSHGLTVSHLSDQTVLVGQLTTVLWTYLMTITLLRL